MAKFTVQTYFDAVDRITPLMKKMGKEVKSVKKQMADSFSGLAKEIKFAAGATTAVAGGIAAATAAASAFASKGDEVAKTARMLGMSTDALQELRYAADMSGVSSEQLDTAFKKLNKNMGDLKSGTGSFMTTIGKLNPQLAMQLKTVDKSEDAFMLLMDAIDKETDSAKKATLAQAAFGGAGQNLIKFASAGADGIKNLREEAHKYGGIISEEAAASSESFNDSLTRMKGAAQSVANVGLSILVEKMQPVIQSIAEWIAANRELISQKIEDVFNFIGGAINFVAGAWNSGLLPAILAGVTAFNLITGAINAFRAAEEIAQVVQLALNVAMNANPIGLIIMAIAAVVAGIVLLLTHLDKVKEFFKWIGEKIKSGVIGKVLSLFGGKKTPNTQQLDEDLNESESSAPMSAQAGIAANSSYSETRSTVDVNFNNAPAGTTIRQSTPAPGVNLNMGSTGGYGR